MRKSRGSSMGKAGKGGTTVKTTMTPVFGRGMKRATKARSSGGRGR